jgi:hypothetical protein
MLIFLIALAAVALAICYAIAMLVVIAAQTEEEVKGD